MWFPQRGPSHYGYYTLKDRTVQFHEPKHVLSDAEAVLEWGLNTPFNSQDKPPLAIAMVVTVNGVRSLRRYRLVIAQKSKLRRTQEVIAALVSHSRDHRLTFFFGRRPLPFGGSHLRLPSGPAGIRTTTGSLSALARPTPYQLSHRVA